MFQASFDAEGVFAIQGGLDATCFGPFREEDVYYFGTVKVAERSLHPNLSQFPLLRAFTSFGIQDTINSGRGRHSTVWQVALYFWFPDPN